MTTINSKTLLRVSLMIGLALSACGKRASAQDKEVRMRYQVALHNQDYYILLPGNRIAEGLPGGGGLDSFDFAQASAANPQHCGTYAMSGNQMTISWGGGRAPTTWQHVRTASNEEEMGGGMWLKGQPFTPGQRLDARYKWSSSVRSGISVLSAASELTLRADGTFSASGIAGEHSSAAGAPNALGSSQQTGTYELNGYTLTLQAAGGATTRHTFFVEGDATPAAKPGIVVFDAAMMFQK